MLPEKGCPHYTVYNRVLTMVYCGLLQLPVPSYKSVRATGRGCYCLVPVHSRVKNNTHIWCLRMEEFSVKCWCGEHFDLGTYQAFVSPSHAVRTCPGSSGSRGSSCGAG